MAVELLSDASFEDKLKTSNGVVVKFFASWCGSCRLFAPKFRRLSETDEYKGIDFIDINAEESPLARSKAKVSNLPYFALFKNGEFVEGVATNKEEMVVELIGKLKG